MPRVYAVESEDELTMVTANSQAQALWHVSKGKFSCHVASTTEVVDYMQQGGVVEDANAKIEEGGVEAE